MPAGRVYLETFGCQMNELDSELVRGRLASLGYRFTPDPAEADVVLYNTCSVREQAEQKVWSRLGDLKTRKAERPETVVGVLGCMAERDGQDLIKRMPVVDILCGPGELDKLPELIDNALRTRLSLGAGRSASQVALQGGTSRRSATLAAAQDDLELLDLSRAISPTDHSGSAYVRITRGCNKFCTYCVVPFTRGAEVHRPPDHIVDECKRLADAGVIEVTLLGQTVNHYRYEDGAAVTVNGMLQPQKGRIYKGASAEGRRSDAFAGERVTTFADLLRRIHDEVPVIKRLRFVTSYPRDFGDDVLEVMRDHPRICRYLHVPAQSGSDRMLKMMNRGYTVSEYDEFLARARQYLDQPELGRPLMISGDIIVGFPTETDEDFEATKKLLERSRYKNCFIFKYSPRPGTVAYDRIPDDVPDEVKRRRNNELLALQTGISEEIGRAQVGREFEVYVEGPSRRAKKKAGLKKSSLRNKANHTISLTVSGREPREAAESHGAIASIDADGTVQLSGRTDGDQIVFFDTPEGRSPADFIGRLVKVRIDAAQGMSLAGSLIG